MYKINPLGIYVYPGLTKLINNISFKVNSINHFNDGSPNYLSYFRVINDNTYCFQLRKYRINKLPQCTKKIL